VTPLAPGILQRGRSYFWSSLQSPGMEQLRLRLDPEENAARGILFGVEEGRPFRLQYKLKWRSDWRVRKVAIESHTAEGMIERNLRSDGRGHWQTDEGGHLPELDGCIDIDIAATPFTNVFPVRRLDLTPGQSAEIRVLYVEPPSLTIKAVTQRYRCLERSPDRHRVTYEGYPSGFKAELALDADGLVIDYPELFRRLAPR
jgi:hypothetical protein